MEDFIVLILYRMNPSILRYKSNNIFGEINYSSLCTTFMYFPCKNHFENVLEWHKNAGTILDWITSDHWGTEKIFLLFHHPVTFYKDFALDFDEIFGAWDPRDPDKCF